MNQETLSAFIAGYVEALLWSSVVEQDGETVNADQFTLSTAGADRCAADCLLFCNVNGAFVARAVSLYGAAQAGHDFALTRNGHGAGYWDRDDLPEDLRQCLTAAAQAAGEANVWLNDEGEVELC